MLGSIRDIVLDKNRIFLSENTLNVKTTYFGLEHTF